ncbi:hypothetical protein MCOR23_008879 [Pyricularia oryzae]|nr:hypothetical protein MCOR23_008879 [Pyricularia oryzae]KAI6401297.1 hypothetical protein MCOR20_008118 [Pyricularia oryzae]KAI6435695.1 hypothetical protein MCOR22_009245 [Pyricularia oryzae]KAI6568932.1 hypothetical protein MCOR09_005617 [Pyricularia oryzae]KAI6618162.1 hypothetical protein MCOR08_009104 [Pyricularia oryzae]
MTTNGISIIFGGACFVESTVEEVALWLNVLERASIKNIDTAELYGHSHFLLGKTGAPSRFTIDTKVPGGLGGDLSTAEAVFQSGKRSLELLGADKAGKYPSIFFQYSLYNKPSLVEALDVWGKIAEDEGVERGELAYRWVVYHSKLEAKSGDGIIVCASKQQQLEVTVEWLRKKPLTDGTAGRINALWELVNAEAPIHNV